MSNKNLAGIPVAAVAAVATVVAILAAGCSGSHHADGHSATDTPGMDSLVTAEWLHANLDDPDLVVLDASVMIEADESGGIRTLSGRPIYDAGHIPTAGYADLKGDLSDRDAPYDYAVPTPERFAEVMGALGVGDDTRVVLYDSYNSIWAARVWWMLRWVGFDNAALLDGGRDAWTNAGYALSTEPANEPARVLTPAVRPELIADRDDVFAAISDDGVDLIDALSEPQYRGEVVNYARPGHIPTATNVPVFSLRTEDGAFKSEDELRALFENDEENRVINYCGGGIAASSNAFIMTRLGYKDVAVYTASLQEWTADPANPMQVAVDLEAPQE